MKQGWQTPREFSVRHTDTKDDGYACGKELHGVLRCDASAMDTVRVKCASVRSSGAGTGTRECSGAGYGCGRTGVKLQSSRDKDLDTLALCTGLRASAFIHRRCSSSWASRGRRNDGF
ncbi:hypothetical protein B0H17DRAFT_1046472 [Mycena rosella]|uniref:Uncharacterized protein n=1 Tax=Mycena rosella TaxID=1033263 RepID=A0AAD7DVI0_MYCRO|nr:hypothetical protein B0H17DRAFT_1046472 [Mycena rosella]